MLRFDHMPSDFDPLFLFLGESEDFAAFADLLRRFSFTPRPIDIRAEIRGTGGRSSLTIIPGEGPKAQYGLHATSEDGSFAWILNSWQASEVAERIEALVPTALRSGSDIIEFGVDGEIPIKISKGEFTDNFLLSAQNERR